MKPTWQSPNGRPDIDIKTWWEGAGSQDLEMLDAVLDLCLATGPRDLKPTLQSPDRPLHTVEIGVKSHWEGTESHDMDMLDTLLDSCLVVGSYGAGPTMRSCQPSAGDFGLLKGMSDGLFDVTANTLKGTRQGVQAPGRVPRWTLDMGFRKKDGKARRARSRRLTGTRARAQA